MIYADTRLEKNAPIHAVRKSFRMRLINMQAVLSHNIILYCPFMIHTRRGVKDSYRFYELQMYISGDCTQIK